MPYPCGFCAPGLQKATLSERVEGYGLACRGTSTEDSIWISDDLTSDYIFSQNCVSQEGYCGLCEDAMTCVAIPPLLGSTAPPTQLECADIPNVCISHTGDVFTSAVDVTNCAVTHGACYYEGYFAVQSYWDQTLPMANCTGHVCQTRYFASLDGYGGEGLCYFPYPTLHCEDLEAIIVLGGCLYINFTESQCNDYAEDVIWLPDSELDNCNQTQVCSYPDYSLSSLTTKRYTNDSAATCNLCQGSMVPVFGNLKRFWVPGTIRTVEWLIPTVVNATAPAVTFDFFTFDLDVLGALEQLFIANLISVDNCLSLVPITAVVNGILQCTTCDRYTDSDIYNCSVQTQIGVATVCSEQVTEMTAEPSFVIFSATSILDGICTTFIALKENREDHLYTESDYLSSPFNIPSNFGNFTYPYVVVNQLHQAVIGDVVTEGVKFEGGNRASYNVTLCFTYDVYDNSSTYLIGIGPEDGGVVYALNTPVYYDIQQGAYCADMEMWIGNASYFLCQLRVDPANWQDIEMQHFTGGERAYLIVIGCLYGLGFAFSLVGLYLSSNHVLFPMLVSISVCFLWRCIHLLVVGISWGRLTNPFLSEPPFFAYLSAVIYLFFVYRSIIKQAKMRLTKGFMKQYVVIVFLLALWLLTFVLLELLLPNSSGAYDHSCYGHIISQPDWPSYRILTLVYFVIFLCVCLCIGVLLMYQTHRLHQLAEDGETKAQTRQIMIISYALCFSITLYAILVISLKTPESTRNDLYLNLSVLWVLEWICPFILSMRSILNPWVAQLTTSSKSRHTSTKRKPSSTSKSQG